MLFFDEESKRMELVRQLRPEVTDVRPEVRVREMREKGLLKEALTRQQRAQIVETFIRHAFSKVQSPSGCLCHSVSCHLWRQLCAWPQNVVNPS